MSTLTRCEPFRSDAGHSLLPGIDFPHRLHITFPTLSLLPDMGIAIPQVNLAGLWPTWFLHRRNLWQKTEQAYAREVAA
jgi:hypothetical protein